MRIAGAVIWIVNLLYFLAQPFAAAAWHPPYSFAVNTISDLGNAYAPRHALMNAVFVIVGLATAAGSYLLRDYWPRRPLVTWGLFFVGISGIGAVMVGLAPADENFAVHGIGALLQIPGAIGPLLLGLATIRRRSAERIFSIVIGVIGIAGCVLFFGNFTLGLGHGATERMGFDPLNLWMIVIAVVVLNRHSFVRSPGGMMSR